MTCTEPPVVRIQTQFMSVTHCHCMERFAQRIRSKTGFRYRFPGEKVHCLQKETDAILLLNQIADCKKKSLNMRSNRCCLLAENVEFTANDANNFEGTLKVGGGGRSVIRPQWQ